MGQERRRFLIATSALLAARVARAQPPQRLRRIGWLTVDSSTNPREQYFRKHIPESLLRLGYEEGRNLVVERRHAENKLDRLPALANELVRLRVELIVTFDNPAAFAAKRATPTIPIVMGTSGLPVEAGLIDSYAHPGGNVTGLDWWPTPQLAEKIWQILKSAVPGAKRGAALWNPKQPLAHLFGDEFRRRVASNTGLTVVTVDITRAEDLAVALDRIAAIRPDVLSVSGEDHIFAHFHEIAAFAAKRKLVSIGGIGYASAGGLLTYGASLQTVTDRIGSYIDRILRGAKPAEIPVEQPTKYDLVLNMKTAKAIGLKLPPAFMAQVDRVIE